MRYVILRDDDTSALTPIACLERLYRPFLDLGLAVNLAVIPEVRTDAKRVDGRLEGFVSEGDKPHSATMALGENPNLVAYLSENQGLHVAQHGCFHDHFEFDRVDGLTARNLLARGRRRFIEAGLPAPRAFVAPHDRFSRDAAFEVACGFEVLSTGWFEFARQPQRWWLRYFLKKIRRSQHWRIGHTALLSHPGCLLSSGRPAKSILEEIKRNINERRLTVLVTHWWEYFKEGRVNEEFIAALHETAGYLAKAPDIRVVSFAEVANLQVPLD